MRATGILYLLRETRPDVVIGVNSEAGDQLLLGLSCDADQRAALRVARHLRVVPRVHTRRLLPRPGEEKKSVMCKSNLVFDQN